MKSYDITYSKYTGLVSPFKYGRETLKNVN